MTRFYRLLALPAVTYGLLLLPIIVFGVYFFALRYNIPWFDEYENIPFLLTLFVEASTWDARIEALLRHRRIGSEKTGCFRTHRTRGCCTAARKNKPRKR
ncbi:MAG: hypothetical protein H7Z72_22540 [Bacteroidetes bacterium]|nr:hypothetical protein [Fibrella sp.]